MSSPTVSEGKNVLNTLAAATLVKKNARMIVQQDAISTIPEIPSLPTHQKAAQDHSQDWIDNVWSPIQADTTAGFIDYANLFQSGYKELQTLLPKLEGGDTKAKEEYSLALQELFLKVLQDKKAGFLASAEKIQAFYDKYQPIYQEFATDFQTADTKIRADNTQLNDLVTQKNTSKGLSDSDELAAARAAIAMPITAYGTLSAGTVGVLIGGMLLNDGDLTPIKPILMQYSEAITNVNDLMKQINTVKSEAAQLYAVEDQIFSLQRNTEDVVTAFSKVNTGWAALIDEMNELIKQSSTSTPQDVATTIQTKLSDDNDQWGVLIDQLKILQQSGIVDSRVFATSDEMIKAIQDQAK